MGTFIGEGSVLFSVRSGMERPEPQEADWPDDLVTYVSIGRHRNVEQDVAFGIQQLVDISLKALSVMSTNKRLGTLGMFYKPTPILPTTSTNN